MTNQTHQPSMALYRRLMQYVKPFWPILTLGIVANIFYALIDASFTYMARTFLDKGFVNIDMPYVKTIPLIILVGISCRGAISGLGTYCMTWVARAVVKVLRQRVFAHILVLPADYYDEATSGQLLSKILYDVEQVAQVSADALTDFLQNTFLVIGLLTVMFVLCWQLSLLFLLTVPVIGYIVNVTNKRVRRISHRVQKNMGQVTEIASESIEGYEVVRLFGGLSYEMNKFNIATEASRVNDMKVAVSKAINTVGVQVVIAVGMATIVIASIKMATILTVTAGSFIAIMAAMLQLIKPMKTLTTLNATFQRGLAGAESVFSLLDTVSEATSGDVLSTRVKGALEFRDVGFRYRDGPWVLEHLNVRVPAGKTIAIVGHSGSGKSTIASLLPRFYELTAGAIFLDGQDISKLSLTSLRSQMALVSQSVVLFNDTLASNIAYGRFDTPKDKIIEAAKLAHANEFIMALPNGYDTLVGENGLMLSGGQRQRIAIARAILKDAPILILDEATSALDNESELYIQQALEVVMKNRTTVIIAHRLSTIRYADSIIVVNKGHIIEQGTHDELLAQAGHYAKLYQTQPIAMSSISLDPADKSRDGGNGQVAMLEA